MLITEKMGVMNAITPVSLATATDSTPIWLEAGDAQKFVFIVDHAQIAATKKLTITVKGATDSSGTGAAKIVDKEITYTGASTGIETIEAPTSRDYTHYAVVIQQDTGGAVVCSAVALTENIYLPTV